METFIEYDRLEFSVTTGILCLAIPTYAFDKSELFMSKNINCCHDEEDVFR